MTEIKKVGILGAGMMGSDIALSCALAGYDVIMKEINQELAQAGVDRIKGNLEQYQKKTQIFRAPLFLSSLDHEACGSNQRGGHG